MSLFSTHSRTALAVALAFVLCALPQSTALGYAGAGLLALPRGADLLIMDAGSGEERVLTLQGDALISSLAWSPTRDRLAVARSSRPPGDSVYGQDIEIVDAAGGKALSSVRRDKPGIILDIPSWTPDGQWLFYDRQETVRLGIEFRIERARTDGSERVTVLENARSPSLSPDASRLAFVRADQGQEVLFVGAADGKGAQSIVPAGKFLLISYPRFSPDGEWIAFATVADPGQYPPMPPPQQPGVSGALGAITSTLLAPRRHGIPWDIWLVRPDGRDLHTARLGEDDPSLAWSPDGSGIAVYGGRGLGILDQSGEVQPIKDEIIGFGGIDWAR